LPFITPSFGDTNSFLEALTGAEELEQVFPAEIDVAAGFTV
jgi:hypothetical protein